MSTSSVRSRALLGGIFSLALVMAPLAVVLDAAAPAAAAPTAPHAARPFLAVSPRTFPSAQATFTVNTTTDSDDAHPGDGACADTAGHCSLRAAVDEANALGQSVVVNVPTGTYNLTVGGAPPSPIEVTDPAGVEINGTGPGVVITNTGQDAELMDVTQGATTTVGAFLALNNVTFANSTGGGLSIVDTNDAATATNVVFTNISAGFSGAAVFDGGQFWANASTFSLNATTEDGGAVYVDDGSARLIGDNFVGNTAGLEGGALKNEDGPMAVDNSTFTNNSVNSSTDEVDGGAFYINEEAELTNDVFTGNSANDTSSSDSAFGGAVYDDYGGTSVTNSTFTGNSSASTAAAGDGAGGAFYDDAAVMVSNSLFASNTVANGSGGGFYEDDEGAYLQGDTVTGNSATGAFGGPVTDPSTDEGYGGGVFCNDICNISNTTISNNSAAQGGGGLGNDDSVIITSSLVSHNTANQGGGIWGQWNWQATSVAIVDNHTTGAGDAGGGVYLPPSFNGVNHVDFVGVTVAGNVSDTGAGFALDGSGSSQGGGTLSNSTVADNRTPAGVEADCAKVNDSTANFPIGSAGGNVVGDASCAFTTNSDRQGASNQGYWEDASDGGIFTYNTGFFGSMGGKPLNKPIVGMAHTPGNQGYWEVASDGGIFSFGDAGFFGSMGGKPLNAPVVGVASTPDGQGYIEVASDGGVFTFGDAGFYGSMGGQPLNKPIVGIAVTPDGRGYWEIASDGGIFAFGDAGFFGSMGGKALNKPIVGIAAAVDGAGYDEVASDGGVFNFGSAGFFGSAGSLHLNAPVVGIATAPDNAGYWTFAADGGVFNYGTGAQFKGSAGSLHLVKPVVGGAGT